MTLMIFTERNHIIPLRKGEKQQTTRPRRKIPIKVGDKLQCYFTSRMKKYTCFNCISENCPVHPQLIKKFAQERGGCTDSWTNFFGEAMVTGIDHCWDTHNWLTDEKGEVYLLKFCDMVDEEPQFLENWARKDGFPLGFKQADEWFTAKYGSDWKEKEMDIIYFEPLWIQLV